MLSMFYCEYHIGSCDFKVFNLILFKFKNVPTFQELGLYLPSDYHNKHALGKIEIK